MQVTQDVVRAAHTVGLCIRVCVSDMGPANQNMWRVVGVHSRQESVVNYISHPCNSSQRLYFMADPPHLLKNVRNCLLTQSITLPPAVVTRAQLPSDSVTLDHVRSLVDLQDNRQLKLAPQLTSAHLSPGQYQKMRVGMAAAVLSHTTATALQFCASLNLLSNDVTTTAWFLDLVNRWFDVMNARLIKASLFRTSTQKLASLREMLDVIRAVKFSGKACWKPIQSGIQLSTQTVLDLYCDLVSNGSYNFLMTGRLTQDCVENLFSCVRGRGDAHPSPVHFRHNLRLISLSQYMRISSSSNYQQDDSEYFLDFLKKKPVSASDADRQDDDDIEFVEHTVVSQECELDTCDSSVCYLLAGWSVHKQTQKVAGCQECLSVICGSVSDAPLEAELTKMKSYGGLQYPSALVFDAVRSAESVFLSHQQSLVSCGNVESVLNSKFAEHYSVSGLPVCHNSLYDIVARYFRLRIHVHAKWLTSQFKSAAVQHGSRSAFCRTKVK